MALFDRLIGRDENLGPVDNRIPAHLFISVCGEWARGKITGAQASSIIQAQTGAPLTAQEQIDAQSVISLVTSISVSGATAAQAMGTAQRAMKLAEIEQVLYMADWRGGAPGYQRPSEVRAKLGL